MIPRRSASRPEVRAPVVPPIEGALRPVIARRSITSPCPLSVAQERLWFIDQLTPGLPTYNAPYVARLSGQIDVPAVQRALETIAARHEILRTTFQNLDGVGVQVIAPEPSLKLQLKDLSGLEEQVREAELVAHIGRQARRAFDLTGDPVLWIELVRLTPDEHVLLLVTHHIGFDGWSRSIFFDELERLYAAYSEGCAPDLPELPMQYGDFATWQRSELQGAALERLTGYWTKQLTDAPPAINVPTDRPRPATPSYQGGCKWLSLPTDLIEATKQVSREVGTTVFMTLLAAFNVFLYAYSGQEDVVVGSPVAGRTTIETEQLIGFFINTLVLRTQLCGARTFRELLGRVRDVCVGAYAHQDLPFSKLVEFTRPVRDASRNPLFQVNFRVQATPPRRLELRGVRADKIKVHPNTSKFDFALELHLDSTELGGFLEYSADLFDDATAAQMVIDLEHIVRAVLFDVDENFRELRAVVSVRDAQEARRRPARSAQLRGFRRLRDGSTQTQPTAAPGLLCATSTI